MRIIFRVDASLQMGTGHVMRCLTLAEVLKENGANVEFICRKHKGNLIDKIRSNGFNVFELKLPAVNGVDNKLFYSHWLGATQRQDAKDCISVLQLAKVDWLIVDHYGIDEDWQQDLEQYCDHLMVIDDLADRKHQCDILLDQTFGRQKQDYEKLVSISCELLLGSQYALLRPEFAKWRQYSIEHRKHPMFKQLLINMGGVDVNNVTEQILKELKVCNLPSDINIVVVMGGSAPHIENVKARVDTLPYKTEVKVDVDNMAEIMANADIAIGAAGVTTWERCCLGLPTIQIVTAKNQEFSAEVLENSNIVKLLTEVKEIANLLKTSTDWMSTISSSAAQICYGTGAYKVFSKLANYKVNLKQFGEVELHNYVNLNLAEKILVLNMRNHPEIKRWMYNQDYISEKSHFKFIQNLEGDFERRYFLVKQQEKIVGSVNFSQIDLHNSVELGLYTNPFEKLRDAGRILEAISVYYAFRELGVGKLKLEVFSDNERAINFYKKCGFEFIETRQENNKDILCMEKRKTLEAIQ